MPVLSNVPDGIQNGCLRACPAGESSSEIGLHSCQSLYGQRHCSRQSSAGTVFCPDRREPVGRYPRDHIRSCCFLCIYQLLVRRGWQPVGCLPDHSSCAFSTSWKPGNCLMMGVRRRCSHGDLAGCCRADSCRCFLQAKSRLSRLYHRGRHIWQSSIPGSILPWSSSPLSKAVRSSVRTSPGCFLNLPS